MCFRVGGKVFYVKTWVSLCHVDLPAGSPHPWSAGLSFVLLHRRHVAVSCSLSLAQQSPLSSLFVIGETQPAPREAQASAKNHRGTLTARTESSGSIAFSLGDGLAYLRRTCRHFQSVPWFSRGSSRV